MIQEINTAEDVKTFFNQLLDESLNFHPDEDFANYINIDTSEPTYSMQDAELRNQLMGKAFEICSRNSVDIYDLSNELSLRYTGLDKLIPCL